MKLPRALNNVIVAGVAVCIGFTLFAWLAVDSFKLLAPGLAKLLRSL